MCRPRTAPPPGVARSSSAIDFAGGSDANRPRACVNSAAWISRGTTCSVAASFAMYAERLPGSGWLLNHCGPPPRDSF